MKALILITLVSLVGCSTRPLKPVKIVLYAPLNCELITDIGFESFDDAKKQVSKLGGDTLTRTGFNTGTVYACNLKQDRAGLYNLSM